MTLSYGFNMFFVEQPVHTKGEALALGDNIVKAMATPEAAQSTIKSSLLYIEDRLCAMCSRTRDRGREFSALQFIIPALFTVRMVWWPKHKLLGICTDRLPEIDGYTFNRVHFQNSTDQDYELDVWSNNIPLFVEIKDAVALDADDNYHLRTGVYSEVMERLHLISWLYGADMPNVYERLSVCGVHSQEQNYMLVSEARTALLAARNE